MTCKDCIHYEVCDWDKDKYDKHIVTSFPNCNEKNCGLFQSKADFVEVVRCKDCKWWYNETDCRNMSGLYRFVPNGNWFCASGERK